MYDFYIVESPRDQENTGENPGWYFPTPCSAVYLRVNDDHFHKAWSPTYSLRGVLQMPSSPLAVKLTHNQIILPRSHQMVLPLTFNCFVLVGTNLALILQRLGVGFGTFAIQLSNGAAATRTKPALMSSVLFLFLPGWGKMDLKRGSPCFYLGTFVRFQQLASGLPCTS